MSLYQKKQTVVFTSLPITLASVANTLFSSSAPTAVILPLTHIDNQPKHLLTHWLHDKELTQLSKFSHGKRHREWLGGRICAKQGLRIYLRQHEEPRFLPGHHQCRVTSEESGRPYFSQLEVVNFTFPELSISHSKEYATAMISSSHCGIDIQYPAENLQRVKERFITEEEGHLLQSSLSHLSQLSQLALVWAGKEALKKMLSPTGIPGFHELTLHKVNSQNTPETVLYFSRSDGSKETFPVAAGIMSNGYSLALCCKTQQF